MFGKIDIEDALAGGLFTIASLVTTGILAVTFLPEDIALGSSVWTIEGTEITFAFVISLAALVAAYATNRYDGSRNDMQVDTDLADIMWGAATMETYVTIATVLIVILNGLNILGVHDIILGNFLIGVVVFSVQLAGYYVISYLG